VTVDDRKPGNGEAVEPGTEEVVKPGGKGAVDRGNGEVSEPGNGKMWELRKGVEEEDVLMGEPRKGAEPGKGERTESCKCEEVSPVKGV
jgi:hypothetical protein